MKHKGQKQKAFQHICHRSKAAKNDYEEEQTREISENDNIGENNTNGSHSAFFSVDVALACNFVASLLPIEMLANKKITYLKWRAILLTIQCTIGTMNYLK